MAHYQNCHAMLSCTLAFLMATSCASHDVMHKVSYEDFSATVERPPELLAGRPDMSKVPKSLIDEALRDGAAEGAELIFVRTVPSVSYVYYVFAVTYVDDQYFVYVSPDNRTFRYRFKYTGEAAPRIEP